MSFFIAGPLYYLANLVWPMDIYPAGHEGVPKTREYMGKTDGFFEEEVILGLGDDSSTREHTMIDKDSKIV